MIEVVGTVGLLGGLAGLVWFGFWWFDKLANGEIPDSLGPIAPDAEVGWVGSCGDGGGGGC